MAKQKSSSTPVLSKTVERRKPKYTKGEESTAPVAVARVKLERGSSLRLVRHESVANLVSVQVAGGKDGLSRPGPQRIEAVGLNKKTLGRFRPKMEIEGHVPDQMKITGLPRRAPLTKLQKAKSTKNRKMGGTIFGNDDRYLFNDRSFPWRTTGLIRTAGGRCSGTTIGRRLVLTASHCINWSSSGGSAGWITFSPGYYDGWAPWGEISATQVIYWNQAPGSLTDRETAFDYAVLVMEDPVGDMVGYPGYRTYNDDWNNGAYWQYIGYPGELAAGERPAFQGSCVIRTDQSFSMSGQAGLVLGHVNEFTPGQSGGAVWGWWGSEPWPRVVGVGSTIGSTAVVNPPPTGTTGDNEYGGGQALSALISWARSNFP